MPVFSSSSTAGRNSTKTMQTYNSKKEIRVCIDDAEGTQRETIEYGDPACTNITTASNMVGNNLWVGIESNSTPSKTGGHTVQTSLDNTDATGTFDNRENRGDEPMILRSSLVYQ